MILVTGANGFLGYYIVHEILGRNEELRVLVRRPDEFPLRQKGLEVVKGDVLDPESLTRAVHGVRHVIHAAAVMSFWKKRHREMYMTNVAGTRNLVQACLESATIKKFVHISALAAAGDIPSSGTFNESHEFDTGHFDVYYGETKHLGDIEVRRGIDRGLPAVFLYPPLILGHGWGDWSRSSAVFFPMIHDGFPFYFDGNLAAVAGEDVARAAYLLCSSASVRAGEKFFLVAENLKQRELFAKIARALGKNPPGKKAPLTLMLAAAHVIEAIAGISGKEPKITPDSVRLLKKASGAVFDGTKITRAISFTYTPLDQVIEKAAARFRQDREKQT